MQVLLSEVEQRCISAILIPLLLLLFGATSTFCQGDLISLRQRILQICS